MNGIPQIFPAPGGGAITGEIRAFIGALPFGWLECDGSAFDAAKYPRLIAVLGAAVLPDLRDASLRGATDAAAANTKSGSNTPSVPVPAHSHGVNVNVANGKTGSGVANSMIYSSGIEALNNQKYSVDGTLSIVSENAGENGATLDVRGSSYYVKFAIYAL